MIVLDSPTLKIKKQGRSAFWGTIVGNVEFWSDSVNINQEITAHKEQLKIEALRVWGQQSASDWEVGLNRARQEVLARCPARNRELQEFTAGFLRSGFR